MMLRRGCGMGATSSTSVTGKPVFGGTDTACNREPRSLHCSMSSIIVAGASTPSSWLSGTIRVQPCVTSPTCSRPRYENVASCMTDFLLSERLHEFGDLGRRFQPVSSKRCDDRFARRCGVGIPARACDNRGGRRLDKPATSAAIPKTCDDLVCRNNHERSISGTHGCQYLRTTCRGRNGDALSNRTARMDLDGVIQALRERTCKRCTRRSLYSNNAWHVTHDSRPCQLREPQICAQQQCAVACGQDQGIGGCPAELFGDLIRKRLRPLQKPGIVHMAGVHIRRSRLERRARRVFT